MVRGKGKKTKITNAPGSVRDVTLGGEGMSLPLGVILGKLDDTPQEAESKDKRDKKAAKEVSVQDLGEYVRSLAQVTLMRETAGRGGRTVTVVSMRPAPSPDTAQALARTIRKNLGCGAQVEECRIVLHGDLRIRAEAWFVKQGAKKVVIGN